MTVEPMELKLSRTALESFIKCPCCFYLQRRLRMKAHPMIPLTLAVATDALLKNEFDAYRANGAMHPLWVRHGLNVRCYVHENLATWRSNFKGIRVVHAATGAEIFGAVDDIWQDRASGQLHIVDYKSTSKKETPTLQGGFGDGYKRQMEIYQWLFRTAGFDVSNTGYFLYVNGRKDGGFFDQDLNGVMRFDPVLIPYQGNTDWVPQAITDAVACLKGDEIPSPTEDCDSCRYFLDRSATLASGPPD